MGTGGDGSFQSPPFVWSSGATFPANPPRVAVGPAMALVATPLDRIFRVSTSRHLRLRDACSRCLTRPAVTTRRAFRRLTISPWTPKVGTVPHESATRRRSGQARREGHPPPGAHLQDRPWRDLPLAAQQRPGQPRARRIHHLGGLGGRPGPGQPQRHARQRQGVDRALPVEGPRPGAGRQPDLRRLDPGRAGRGGQGADGRGRPSRGGPEPRPGPGQAVHGLRRRQRPDRLVAGRRRRQPHARSPLGPGDTITISAFKNPTTQPPAAAHRPPRPGPRLGRGHRRGSTSGSPRGRGPRGRARRERRLRHGGHADPRGIPRRVQPVPRQEAGRRRSPPTRIRATPPRTS